MTQDKSRAAFEAKFSYDDHATVRLAGTDRYIKDSTRYKFAGWQASEQRIMDELGSEGIKKIVGAAICKAFQDNAVLWIEPAAHAALTAITNKLKGE